jgi:hypothetical protein
VEVTAIGDSVMLGAANELARVFGAVNMNAAVGRQAAEAIEILRAQKAAGTLGSLVLLHVGNNGPLREGQVDEMMEILSDVPRVLIMNLHVARAWEGPNNAILGAAASKYRNAKLVDWASMSAGHPELFWDDQIHLRPAGATVYAELFASLAR